MNGRVVIQEFSDSAAMQAAIQRYESQGWTAEFQGTTRRMLFPNNWREWIFPKFAVSTRMKFYEGEKS